MRVNTEYLKERMEQENMSRSQFCERSGISASGLCRILKGERSGSFDILEGLIRAFPEDDYRSFLIIEDGGAGKRKEEAP